VGGVAWVVGVFVFLLDSVYFFVLTQKSNKKSQGRNKYSVFLQFSFIGLLWWCELGSGNSVVRSGGGY